MMVFQYLNQTGSMMNYRLLDKLVAEKFMELCIHENTEYINNESMVLQCLNCHEQASQTAVIMAGWGNALSYSTDMNYAWEVFEELRNSGKYCCLTIKSDYNYVYDVDLILSELLGNILHKRTIHITNENLPFAICLAALDTVGINQEEVYKLLEEKD